MPSTAQTALTFVVGAVVAYIAFKIVAKIIKGIVMSVIAAILAFLLTTVPGNLLLSQAYNNVEQRITTSLSNTSESN